MLSTNSVLHNKSFPCMAIKNHWQIISKIILERRLPFFEPQIFFGQFKNLFQQCPTIAKGWSYKLCPRCCKVIKRSPRFSSIYYTLLCGLFLLVIGQLFRSGSINLGTKMVALYRTAHICWTGKNSFKNTAFSHRLKRDSVRLLK